MTALDWQKRLNLEPHPEGGWFSEWYRSTDELSESGLPSRFPGSRSASTAIAYLLEGSEKSRFHRIRSDEAWHFYDGGILELFELTEEGGLILHTVGCSKEPGVVPFLVIPAGSWFASRVRGGEGYVLAGCTVAPGFDFQDFELADPEKLCLRFPEARSLIEEFA